MRMLILKSYGKIPQQKGKVEAPGVWTYRGMGLSAGNQARNKYSRLFLNLSQTLRRSVEDIAALAQLHFVPWTSVLVS